MQLDSTHREHTFRQHTHNSNQKWSGIRILISELIRIRIPVSIGSLPKCSDLLPSRRQSFRRMSWQPSGNLWEMLRDLLKMPYNGERSGIRIRCRVVGLIITSNFNEIGWLLFQMYKQDRLHYLLYRQRMLLKKSIEQLQIVLWSTLT